MFFFSSVGTNDRQCRWCCSGGRLCFIDPWKRSLTGHHDVGIYGCPHRKFSHGRDRLQSNHLIFFLMDIQVDFEGNQSTIDCIERRVGRSYLSSHRLGSRFVVDGERINEDDVFSFKVKLVVTLPNMRKPSLSPTFYRNYFNST